MTNAMPAALAETSDRWAPPFTTISGEGPFLPLKSLPVARRAGLRFYRWAESGARRDRVSRPSVSGGPSRPFTWPDGEVYGETRCLGEAVCESRARARSYVRNGRANASRCQNRIWAVGATGKRDVWALILTFSLWTDPVRFHFNIRPRPRNSHYRRPNARFPYRDLPPRKRIRRDRAAARKRPPAPLPNTPCGASTPADSLN